MANIVISNASPLFTDDITEIRSFVAGAGGITQGFAFYVDPTTGTALPTDGTSSSKVAVRGIALDTVGAGQAFDGLEKGYVAGLDVSGSSYDALIYVSDTVGRLGTTAGSNSSVAGRVAPLSDKDPVTGKPSKVFYFRPSVI